MKCGCGNAQVGAYWRGQCRKCWLNLNVKEYAKKWGAPTFALPHDVIEKPNPVPARVTAPTLDVVRILPPSSQLCVISMATGKQASELFTISGSISQGYARRIGADFQAIEPSLPEYPYPLAWKWAIGRFLAVYDRVIFLDADIVLTHDCPNLFEIVPSSHIGLHDDWPLLESTDWLNSEYTRLAGEAAWSGLSPPGTCYNTGVVIASRKHAKVFDPPPGQFTVSHTAEQSWVNLQISRLGVPVQRLPWQLNWQWYADKNFTRTQGVKVWHFANCKPHNNRLELMRLAASGRLSDAVRPRLSHCKHLGRRVEFRTGCGGAKCRHECEQGLPAVPNGYCQSCTKYAADE